MSTTSSVIFSVKYNRKTLHEVELFCVHARACAHACACVFCPSFFWCPLCRCVLHCFEDRRAVSTVRLVYVVSVDLVFSLHYPLLQRHWLSWICIVDTLFIAISDLELNLNLPPLPVTASHFSTSASLFKITSGTWLAFSNRTFLLTGHMTCFCLGLWSAYGEWNIFLLSAILHLSISHLSEMRNVISEAVSRVLFLKWKPHQIKFVCYCWLSKCLFW
jgi:hypothetical protein